MEQLAVNSKSYLIRWTNVSANHTISWSLQPHKKSICFGIIKHPGAAGGLTPNLPSSSFEAPPSPGLVALGSKDAPSKKGSSAVTSSVVEKLEKLGMKSVVWYGKCEAERVAVGKYTVPEGEGGMYGLVFDNTRSKQISKSVTFALMTYPANAPPKSESHLHFAHATGLISSSSLGSKPSPALLPTSDSNESLPHDANLSKLALSRSWSRSRPAMGYDGASLTGTPSFYTGVLSKKRRKRNQPYARRFFSLDFTSNTLSYYKNRNSSALRGAIPLSLAAIGTNEKTREISIDSGAEIWLLRAYNRKDFLGWRGALEKASQSASTPVSTATPQGLGINSMQGQPFSPVDDREWSQVESLVGRVAGITDAVRRLAKDTDPKSTPAIPATSPGILGSNSTPSPVDLNKSEYFSPDDKSPEKGPFWKRKPSTGNQGSSSIFSRRNLSGTGQTARSLAISPSNGTIQNPKRQNSNGYHDDEEGMHGHCIALLRDLDSVVAEFSALIADSRKRRLKEPPISASRQSTETTRSQEFFDAEDGFSSPSQLLTIRQDSDHGEGSDRDASDAGDSESTIGSEGDCQSVRSLQRGQPSLFPHAPKSLTPLPHGAVGRRSTVPPSSGNPPSLISFLRKNVGKDLSTIAMPVTANEPLSLLQRQAEQLEYSELLDQAVVAPVDTGERLLHVAAFAVSALSGSRVKERAIRKPFNPMLGETFELVREDKDFRFLAEKVSHRPVRVACQGETKEWTFTHAPMPTQKFWGKSAELTIEGRVRVVLHSSGACFSWAPATCFLRNIIAGEKYVEPVQTMTVVDESTGQRAIVTFKAGGVFSGRSEEVGVQCLDAGGNALPLRMDGKWTSELRLSDGRIVWAAGATVPNVATHYGMTAFSATLNEVTPLEAIALPPTDSRLRPDQREYEDGHVDKAEKLKATLEDGQRRRRKEMEVAGRSWEARWFEMVSKDGEEEAWRMKERDGYWDVREAVVGFKGGHWNGVREVFEV